MNPTVPLSSSLPRKNVGDDGRRPIDRAAQISEAAER